VRDGFHITARSRRAEHVGNRAVRDEAVGRRLRMAAISSATKLPLHLEHLVDWYSGQRVA
jgi:hypothetical protein